MAMIKDKLKRELNTNIYLEYLEIFLLDNYSMDEYEYLKENYLNEDILDKLDHFSNDKYYFDSVLISFRREKRIKKLLEKNGR